MLNMLERVRQIIRHLSGAVAAFSGGTDSAVLLRIASSVLGPRLLAVTATGPIHSPLETRRAQALALAWDVAHLEISLHQLQNPAFAANGPDRCYHCKTALFKQLRELADVRELPHVIDGTNAEDVRHFRPGLAAVAAYGVRSPLWEAGLTKADVRALARHLDIPDPDHPAESCLCTRIPYGRPLTFQLLEQVAQGEALLRAIGFSVVRLRHYGDLASIEVLPEEGAQLLDDERRARLQSRLAALGFSRIHFSELGRAKD